MLVRKNVASTVCRAGITSMGVVLASLMRCYAPTSNSLPRSPSPHFDLFDTASFSLASPLAVFGRFPDLSIHVRSCSVSGSSRRDVCGSVCSGSVSRSKPLHKKCALADRPPRCRLDVVLRLSGKRTAFVPSQRDPGQHTPS